MNILSWAALAVLVYYAFKGWRRGLIMTVFSMFATVIAIALAAQLLPNVVHGASPRSASNRAVSNAGLTADGAAGSVWDASRSSSRSI